ncbi:hypothetical protein JAAARDRAFT_205384 [Jaapia argillacea MUCL 33604]|uniref:F-box domain-containing protein n=1 Tax=Jaapia argillacea MUCL 33604 TaxID=933084 RepID=A0A067Q060_9AGAM|nr:hypothetical protein JAAARDRAFT_205384 [Jaapia argillacea MUCL 33604]
MQSSTDYTCLVPSEILLEIFKHIPQEAPRGSDREWLAITAVCRRWREIALSSSDLWSTIYITSDSSRQTPLFFERSNIALLDVGVGCFLEPEDISVGSQQLSSNISRVYSLLFTGMPIDDLCQFLRPLMDRPAPELHSFVIAYPDETPEDEFGDGLLISSLFSGVTPHLRVLSLQYASLPWSSSIYSGLVDLRLYHEHSDAHPSAELFLSALENCPSLRILSLQEAGPIDPYRRRPYRRPSRKVTLSQLQVVKLDFEEPKDTAHVLSHLSLPPLVTLAIVTTHQGELDTVSYFTKYLQQLSNPSLECAGATPHYLRLGLLPEDTISLSYTLPRLNHLPETLPLNCSALHATVKEGDPYWFFTHITSKCMSPSRQPMCLFMDGWGDMLDVSQWSDGLRGWTRLRMMNVKDLQEQDFFEALGTVYELDPCSPEAYSGIICPSLGLLRIERTPPSTGDISENWVEDLETCLKLRDIHNAPLHMLQLSGIVMSDAHLERLNVHRCQIVVEPWGGVGAGQE